MPINISNDCESSLKLNELLIKEISMTRDQGEISATINVSFAVEIKENENQETECKLSCYIDDENGILKLSVTVLGVFTIVANNLPNEAEVEILNQNTIAIMFPYLRSTISIASTQPGMQPIVLPPMNINALLDNIKNG